MNDFLTGRAPLLLAMKLGEHMMFVQLQLSNTCNARRRSLHNAMYSNSHASTAHNTPSCHRAQEVRTIIAVYVLKLFLFSIKMLVFRAEIKETRTNIQNFRKFTV